MIDMFMLQGPNSEVKYNTNNERNCRDLVIQLGMTFVVMVNKL